MNKTQFIFAIEAEKHCNVLVRIVSTFNRQRIAIKEFSSQSKHTEDQLNISIAFEESKDNALKLSRRLDKEVDIISVNLFEKQ